MKINISNMTRLKEILYESIYKNYDNVIALATEITNNCNYLSYSNYNPVSKTIEFKIKKSNAKKATDFNNLSENYYSCIANSLLSMIQITWKSEISTYILNKYGSIHSKEYNELIEIFDEIYYNPNSIMLLFNLTTTMSNTVNLTI